MTTTPSPDQRARFEQWQTERGYIIDRDENGDYSHPFAKHEWAAWQAALTQPTPPREVAQGLREAVRESLDSLGMFITPGIKRQITDKLLAALAPYVTAPSSPAPTSGKEGTPDFDESVDVLREDDGNGGSFPVEVVPADVAKKWFDQLTAAREEIARLTPLQYGPLLTENEALTKELISLRTDLTAAREELAAVQNRKIEACIAWTEAQAQLATLRAERDKFQDMARASESALTAVSWPLVKADRSGDSPDVIAERLVSQLATLRATSEELAGALERTVSFIEAQEYASGLKSEAAGVGRNALARYRAATPSREAQGLREDLGVLIARFGRACYDYAMARDATKEEVSVAYEKQEKLRDQIDRALATLGQQRDAARGEVEALEATIRTYRPAVNEAHDLRQQLAEIDAVLGKRAHDVVGAAKDAMDDNAELRQQLAEARGEVKKLDAAQNHAYGLLDPAVFHATEILELIVGTVEDPNPDIEEIADYIRTKMRLAKPAPADEADGEELLDWLEAYITTRSEELAVELHAEVMAGNVVKEYAARSALAELSALRSARVGKQEGNKS